MIGRLLFWRDASGVAVPVDASNPLPVAVSAGVSLDAGDIEIGAVELKDGASDQRATVSSAGALLTRETPAAVAATHTGDNAVTTAETILASNANRKGVLIQNLAASGGKSIRVTLDNTTPTASLGIQIIAQASLLLSAPECGTNNIKAITEDGTSVNVGVTEFA